VSQGRWFVENDVVDLGTDEFVRVHFVGEEVESSPVFEPQDAVLLVERFVERISEQEVPGCPFAELGFDDRLHHWSGRAVQPPDYGEVVGDSFVFLKVLRKDTVGKVLDVGFDDAGTRFPELVSTKRCLDRGLRREEVVLSGGVRFEPEDGVLLLRPVLLLQQCFYCVLLLRGELPERLRRQLHGDLPR
jgi:hypothetical protein